MRGVDVKNDFSGGLDLDSSLFKVAKNCYVDALNITRDAVQGSEDEIISNVVGNRQVSYTLPTFASGTIAFTTGQNPFTANGSNIGTITATPGSVIMVQVAVSNYHAGDFVRGNIGAGIQVNDTTVTVTYVITVPIGGVINFNLYLNGTATVNISLLTGGTYKRIGSYANTLRNTIVYMVYNSLNYDMVLEYNNTTRTIVPIFTNLTDSGGIDITGFTETGKITGINIFNRDEGDLLFFLDSIGRPTYMDITLFKAQTYTPVTRDIIDVCLRQPLVPISAAYGNDTTKVANNFFKKLTKYRYRWIYDDFGKGCYSTISAVPLPPNITNPAYTNITTNNNLINLTLNSGPQNVKGIELDVSISENSNQFPRFQKIKVIDKATDGIGDNLDFTISFYNDSTYPFIDDNESELLYDFVPDNAIAQEFPNGNVDAYGGITEGYNRDLSANVVITINTIAAGGGGSVGTLTAVPVNLGTLSGSTIYRIPFNGVPATGTVVTINLITIPGGSVTPIATYITVAGDTTTNIVQGLFLSMTSIGIGTVISHSGNVIIFSFSALFYNFNSLIITPPSVTTTTNSIATWPWSTQRSCGISYYNKQGKTNGILYNAKIAFPAYAENGSQQPLLPYVNIKIYHVPPIWAESYQIDFTKEPSEYLFFECIDVNTTETAYLYFEITNLPLNQKKNPTTAQVISWQSQEGDKMRLIKKVSDGTVLGASFDTFVEGIVADPTINNVVQTGKTFIKIKRQSPFGVPPFDASFFASKFFILELYRPGVQPPTTTNEAYYECGVQFAILDPGTSVRRHAGQITNQSSDYVTPAELNVYNGDSYFRSRTISVSETGTATFYVQDRNFVDFYISSVSSIDGRPLAIEENARAATYGATIRHSEAYQPNTNINGLHRFFENNILDCDYSHGSIAALKARDKLLKVFQANKTGRIPLFSQINRQTDGTTVQVVTDKLLNPVEYYVGNWGIGTATSSLVSNNFADYFFDNIRGAILRSSYDGIDVTTILYRTNSWAVVELPLRTGSYFGYGGWDQKLNNYILALEAAPGSSAQTIVFSEGEAEHKPSFESFISLYTEGMCTLGTLLVSWKDGQLWTHDSSLYNNFYGVQYDSYITPAFNDNILLGKSYIGFNQFGNTVWDCPEIITQTNSYGTTPQLSNLVTAEFNLKEGKHCASFKRDVNSRGGKTNGDTLKGQYVSIKIRKQSASNLITLAIAEVVFIESPVNNR